MSCLVCLTSVKYSVIYCIFKKQLLFTVHMNENVLTAFYPPESHGTAQHLLHVNTQSLLFLYNLALANYCFTFVSLALILVQWQSIYPAFKNKVPNPFQEGSDIKNNDLLKALTLEISPFIRHIAYSKVIGVIKVLKTETSCILIMESKKQESIIIDKINREHGL